MALTDLERKLITIIQHHNKRSKSPTIKELEIRSGHPSNEISYILDDLIKRGWLKIESDRYIVTQKLF